MFYIVFPFIAVLQTIWGNHHINCFHFLEPIQVKKSTEVFLYCIVLCIVEGTAQCGCACFIWIYFISYIKAFFIAFALIVLFYSYIIFCYVCLFFGICILIRPSFKRVSCLSFPIKIKVKNVSRNDCRDVDFVNKQRIWSYMMV